jgi:hypothetical protein
MIDSERPREPVPQAEQDWIDYLCRSQWIVPATPNPVHAEVVGQDQIVLGGYRASIRDAAAAHPGGSVDETLKFCLVHDHWKVVPIHVYRPLAYYAAFGRAEVFECLQIAVRSLLIFGNWKHDIGVLTRAEDVDAVVGALASLKLGERLYIETVPGDDILD